LMNQLFVSLFLCIVFGLYFTSFCFKVYYFFHLLVLGLTSSCFSKNSCNLSFFVMSN
jgi:hypothetical protein